MSVEVFSLVRAMLESEDPPSRNRQFADFSSEEGQKAYRLYRLYRSWTQELESAAQRPDMRVEARSEDGGLMLQVMDPKVAYRRTTIIPQPLVPHFMDRLSLLGLGTSR